MSLPALLSHKLDPYRESIALIPHSLLSDLRLNKSTRIRSHHPVHPRQPIPRQPDLTTTDNRRVSRPYLA
eukprot:2811298-Prymnesium_polylepis.1